MSNKNIIIAPCGNKSVLFKTEWLKDKAAKEFDLCLLFYHAEINQPGLYSDAEYFFHLKDFKFKMIYDVLSTHSPNLLEQYEYFYFLDDDIAIDTAGINKMFAFSKAFNLWISQASLSQDSFNSWPILKNDPGCILRYMGQIEVMAPLFNKYALQKCLPSFIGNTSSWGLDSVWGKLLNYPYDKVAVIDAVEMRHTQPVGGGELYSKLQIDPYKEWEQITKQYDAIPNNFIEVGRVQIFHKKSNKSFYKMLQLSLTATKVWRAATRGNLIKAIVGQIKERRKDHTKRVT